MSDLIAASGFLLLPVGIEQVFVFVFVNVTSLLPSDVEVVLVDLAADEMHAFVQAVLSVQDIDVVLDPLENRIVEVEAAVGKAVAALVGVYSNDVAAFLISGKYRTAALPHFCWDFIMDHVFFNLG